MAGFGEGAFAEQYLRSRKDCEMARIALEQDLLHLSWRATELANAPDALFSARLDLYALEHMIAEARGIGSIGGAGCADDADLIRGMVHADCALGLSHNTGSLAEDIRVLGSDYRITSAGVHRLCTSVSSDLCLSNSARSASRSETWEGTGPGSFLHSSDLSRTAPQRCGSPHPADSMATLPRQVPLSSSACPESEASMYSAHAMGNTARPVAGRRRTGDACILCSDALYYKNEYEQTPRKTGRSLLFPDNPPPSEQCTSSPHTFEIRECPQPLSVSSLNISLAQRP